MDSADRQRLLILAAIVALGPLSIDMYLPSLPALQRHFGSDAASAQLTLSAYFLGLAFGQMIYGPVSDHIGRKGPLLFGLGLYLIASLGCIFAPDIGSLTLLRLVQALGGCAGMVITRAIVRDLYPPQEMARVLSLLVLIMGIAPILAPLAGGWVFQHGGWQAIFAVLVAYGALCLLLVSRRLPETLVPTGAPLRLAVVLGGYARLLAHRRFMGYALSGGIAQSGMFAYIAASSFVFMELHGLSATAYALLFGGNAFGLILASQLNARLLRHLRSERVLRLALATYAVGGLALLTAAVTGIGGFIGLGVPLFVCVASLGFTFPNSTAAAMAPFGDRAGTASALLGTLQFAFAFLSSSLVAHLHDGTALPMAAVIAGCGALAFLLLHTLAPAR
ncbi:MAG TPA: multidrug effflux MFS transporter [Solimonas sp.]|nr:multidrug effflux MFS transporter [Solimonas sp.]